MKPFITAILLCFAAVPAVAQSVTFPTLTYPESAPAPQPVTQEEGGIQN